MAPLLAWLGDDGSSAAVQRLCCSSIGSICQLRQGRDAFVAAGGVAVLTSALLTTPDEAMAAFTVSGAQLHSGRVGQHTRAVAVA